MFDTCVGVCVLHHPRTGYKCKKSENVRANRREIVCLCISICLM